MGCAEAMSNRYDVVRIRINDPEPEIIAEDKSFADAEAIMHFAIMRQGVDGQYFKVVERDAP